LVKRAHVKARIEGILDRKEGERMGDMNRRHFIGTAAALAAGAGMLNGTSTVLAARENYREHGPISFRMYFFHPDPIVIKGSVFVDEAKNIFGMRAYGNRGEVFAEMTVPYSLVKNILDTGRTSHMYARVQVEKETKIKVMGMSIESKKFMVREYEKPAVAFWAMVEDVRRVV
jgi:hypothetical protein